MRSCLVIMGGWLPTQLRGIERGELAGSARKPGRQAAFRPRSVTPNAQKGGGRGRLGQQVKVTAFGVGACKDGTEHTRAQYAITVGELAQFYAVGGKGAGGFHNKYDSGKRVPCPTTYLFFAESFLFCINVEIFADCRDINICFHPSQAFKLRHHQRAVFCLNSAPAPKSRPERRRRYRARSAPENPGSARTPRRCSRARRRDRRWFEPSRRRHGSAPPAAACCPA